MSYRIFAWIQLLALVFYFARPMMPYIEYSLNKDFIAKNYCVKKNEPRNCCQGMCYLDKQIQKMSNSKERKAESDAPKTQYNEFKEFLTSFNWQITPATTSILFIRTDLNLLSKYLLISVFIPPESLS